MVDVLTHVLTLGSEYDLNNLTMGGFSAGAAISLCVSATSPVAQNSEIKAVVCFYPPIDLAADVALAKSGPPGSTAILLTPGLINLFNSSLAQGSTDLSDPRISAMNADVNAFPKKIW